MLGRWVAAKPRQELGLEGPESWKSGKGFPDTHFERGYSRSHWKYRQNRRPGWKEENQSSCRVIREETMSQSRWELMITWATGGKMRGLRKQPWGQLQQTHDTCPNISHQAWDPEGQHCQPWHPQWGFRTVDTALHAALTNRANETWWHGHATRPDTHWATELRGRVTQLSSPIPANPRS